MTDRGAASALVADDTIPSATTLCLFRTSIAYGCPDGGLALASHRRHKVTQLEALHQARQLPAAHSEQHGGLALVAVSQRQRVHEVPSHGGRECLEIVSHVNRIHSTDSFLLPPSVTTLALAAENPASACSDVAARADIRRHSLQMASDGTPPRHR